MFPDEFKRVFGRHPADAIIPYRMEDAELALVSMGTTAATVRTAVDSARAQGRKVGAVRIRMFRPFPEELLRELLGSCRRINFVDRDISLGHGGVLWSEGRGTLAPGTIAQGYVIGLGGGDIRPQHVEELIEDLAGREQAAAPRIVEVG